MIQRERESIRKEWSEALLLTEEERRGEGREDSARSFPKRRMEL
jgi:hypothetical protein